MSDVTVESVQLEVSALSTQAAKSLDVLTNTLGKLKGATKGGLGLPAVAKQLTTLNTALNSISSTNADNLNKMAQGLQALSTCGNLKLSSSVANQITNLGTAVRSLNGADFSALNRLASALTPLSTIGKSNLNSFISQLQRLPQAVQGLNSVNMSELSGKLGELVSVLSQLSNLGKNNLTSFVTQLNKIPKLMENLKNVDMRTLYNQIQSLVRVFTPLATQMEKISAGFAAFPARIQKLITSTNNLSKSNDKASTSYVNLAAKIGVAVVAMKRIGRTVANMIYDATEWEGITQRFGRAFGSEAEEAYSWIKRLNSEMSINTQQFMQYSSIFGTMLKGFGVVERDAAKMAMGYTELVYDIWAGYNDIYTSFEDAAIAVRSAIAGEVEPIRKAGFTIVDSQLKVTAANYGIAYSSQAASEELKSYLRYLTLVGQADAQGLIGTYAREMTTAEGLMRTLRQQIISLGQAFGSVLLPIVAKILPYVQAFVSLLTDAIVAVATLFGVTIQPVTFSSGLSAGASAAEDLSDNIGDAGKKAKELKTALLGIDELNIISPPEDTSGSGAGGIGGAGGGGLLDVDKLWDESIFESVNQQVAELKEKLKELVPIVAGIGAGLAAWKIAKSVTDFLNTLSSMKGFTTPTGLVGFIMLIADLKKFTEYLQDILENGASVKNVAGLIAEGLGAIGDAFIILGKVDLGATLKIIQGVGEIVSACADIANNGVNWDNVSTAIRGVSNIGIGIGLLTMKTGGLKIVGWSLVAQGISGVLGEIDNIMEAVRTGDWSGVDKVTLIISAIEIIGGLAVAFDAFSKLKEVVNIGKSTEAVQTVATATEALDTTVSTKLSPNLTSLAKNLGLGIVIIGEVAVAAGIIVGAIWGLGVLLEQVGEAWQPVIENGGTVAAAMGIGVGILAAVGVVTALLGSVGTPLIVNIALGTAILAELGVATGLFLVEIWAIGKGLDEIGQAWQPVLDNGETIATAIGLGTALLVGIGVVTAALGVATVASAGLLPLAIGLGTALLVELAAAFVLFCESLVATADELGNNLAPALKDLNGKLPTLSDNMSDFVDFMTEFAGQVVRYTEVSAIAGLSATIDTIIGWFTQDPVEKLADDVQNIYDQTSSLNEKLRVAVPELKTAIDLLTSYRDFLSQMETLCNVNVELSSGIFVNMKEVGQKLVTGFVDGIKSKSSDFSNAAKTLVDGFKNSLNTNTATCKSSFISWASNLKNWFTSASFGAINRTTFGNYAKDIVSGFNNGITNNYATAKSGMVSFANTVKTAFTGIVSYSVFYDIAKDVISGFNNGINDFYDTTRPYMRRWANDAAAAYKAALDSNSPSKRFMRIGEDTVLGYNLGISNLGGTTKGVVTDWANSFASMSPTMSFAVDTSALKYYNSDSFAQSVSAEIASNSKCAVESSFSADGFKDAMIQALVESGLIEDVRRQADKQERTIVQIGNRTVTDTVTAQQRANGYRFVTP